jgi:hypothetical protein
MAVKFKHCTCIYLDFAYLYYYFSKPLNGYMITSLVTADNIEARMQLANVLHYFIKTIVKDDAVYCSLFLESNEIFKDRIHYHSEYDKQSIFKIDTHLYA